MVDCFILTCDAPRESEVADGGIAVAVARRSLRLSFSFSHQKQHTQSALSHGAKDVKGQVDEGEVDELAVCARGKSRVKTKKKEKKGKKREKNVSPLSRLIRGFRHEYHWPSQCEWHRMTRMTGPDYAVMCNLINTHTHTQINASGIEWLGWQGRIARLCAI